MLDTLESGDILLGDAFYATYFLLCALQERGVDGVFEQQGSRRRSTDFRRGRRLGPRDHVIELRKPKIKPDWMSQADYEQAPDSLEARELYTGGKILMTTLLCPKRTTKAALKVLYRDRWHAELDLRNINTHELLNEDPIPFRYSLRPGPLLESIYVKMATQRSLSKCHCGQGSLPNAPFRRPRQPDNPPNTP